MSRRDTIMIAILVNAGILIALFAFSLRETSGNISDAPVAHKSAALPVVAAQEAAPAIEHKEVAAPVAIAARETKPTPTLASHSAYDEISVSKGDSLDKLAKNYHTSVEELIRINGLQTTLLSIGQKVRVPKRLEAKPQVTSIVATSDEAKYYVVKSGENPWTIAVKNGLKVEELLQLNGLNEDKARRLKPGDRLRIR